MGVPVRDARLSDEYGENMECILEFVRYSHQKSGDCREAASLPHCGKINENMRSLSRKKCAYNSTRNPANLCQNIDTVAVKCGGTERGTFLFVGTRFEEIASAH